MFDAREYRRTLEKPTYIDQDADGNEVRFEGELVAFNTVVEILDDIAKLGDTSPVSDVDALVERTVRAIRMNEAAIAYILALPIDGRLECILSFFTVLRGKKKASPTP
jgi:hypothetical protein